MKLIKRKIALDTLFSRNPDTYGQLVSDSIYIKVFLTQDIQNLGIFSDTSYIPEETNPVTVEDYYSVGEMITGMTDSKLSLLKTYKRDETYRVNFDLNAETYIDFTGNTINGVDRVTSLDGPTGYTFNANNDVYIGTSGQTSGIQYFDYNSQRTLYNEITQEDEVIPLTTFSYRAEGWNETNTTLSGLTKEEMLLFITEKPIIESDVFIDRSTFSVYDSSLKLSEIRTLSDLETYGNGFFNLITT